MRTFVDVLLKGFLIISIVVIAVVLFLLLITGTVKDTIKVMYPETAIVVGLDYDSDIVTVRNYNGHLWEFNGCEDYAIDDVVGMIMFDNGTREISDDQIIDVRYTVAF